MNSTTSEDHRTLRLRQFSGNVLRRGGINGGPGNGSRFQFERAGGQIDREKIHGNINQHGTRPARLRQVKGALHDSRKILGAANSINSLTEGTAQFELIAVEMEIDFLMRMPPVKIGLDVADN